MTNKFREHTAPALKPSTAKHCKQPHAELMLDEPLPLSGASTSLTRRRTRSSSGRRRAASVLPWAWQRLQNQLQACVGHLSPVQNTGLAKTKRANYMVHGTYAAVVFQTHLQIEGKCTAYWFLQCIRHSAPKKTP